MLDLETPAMVVHEPTALKNILAFQSHCDQVGLKLRPHIKTHKTIHFARAQLEAGAAGITCQKIGEAEVMAQAGIADILITYNILGSDKLERLQQLAQKLSRLAVTADNATVIEGLARTFVNRSTELHVMVECDTGAERCGVQSPDDAVALARLIVDRPGLSFAGLMTYPTPGGADEAALSMKSAVSRLTDLGIDCPDVSTGGTPDMWTSETKDVFTEYRIGTYIYNDRSLLARGTCQESDCAAHVVATVVSTPAPGRAVIDAGSKVLTSDLLGLDGHGSVVGHPDAAIVKLSEEHGVLNVNPQSTLTTGDQIRIIPNHVCVVSNMFDSIWLDNGSNALVPLPVDARGRVW